MKRLVLTLALLTGPLVQGQTDPAQEQASFRVLDGFEVNLFASEKEGVRKPIQIRFDPDGRLWVVGSTVYPQIKPGQEPDDQVIVLQDTDRDGRADRSTVFAGGLHIPTGLELGQGGVYVGAATELLHLRDTNGDGKADERRVVLRGFGTGDTHQTINSFCWGPLGELMMSQGLHAESRVETPWGVAELRQAGVWRFWPGQVRLDPFWTGAMGAHNPFGTSFDEWGQPFVFAGNGHGVYHLTQAMIATDHFLEQRSIWNQGRKFGGADFVQNSHWPAANQGEVISGGYLQNTVERFRLTQDGSTFKAERLLPLVESTNTAFRIVDVRFGPDGALYLCDWYNPIIGHYQNSFRDPNRDKANGRIWRVTAKGRPLVMWTPLGAVPTPELVKQLASPQRWNRQMARMALADREPVATTEALRTGAQTLPATGSDLARWEVLGAQIALGKTDLPLLQQLAGSVVPEARAAAARAAGELSRRIGAGQPGEGFNAVPAKPGTVGVSGDAALLLELLSTLVQDEHPRVRLEAVVACSYVPSAAAMDIAARVADRPMDSALTYAFTQCVAALRPWWSAAQARGELKLLANSAQAAAFAQAEGGAGSVGYAAGRLRRIGEVALDAPTIRQLSGVVASSGGPAELGVLLAPRSFTVGTNYDASLHARRLREAAESSRRRGVVPTGDVASGWQRLSQSASPEVRAAASELAGAWKIESQRASLEALVTPDTVPILERVAAVEGIGWMGGPKSTATLLTWSGSALPGPVRAAAVAGLVPLQLDAAAGQAAQWWQGSADPGAVATVLQAFIRQQNGLGALLAALKVRPPTAANARVLQEVLARNGRHEPDLNLLLGAALGADVRKQPWSAADIPAVVAAVRASADRTRGAQLFASPQLACTTCHAVDGTPGRVGPDLGALGTAQTLEFVVGALIEPQREVKEGFMAHELVVQDGTTYQGYLRGETAETVTILDHLSGRTVVLPRASVVEQRQLGSLMPAGLVDGLSAEELRDLVAYLAALGKK